MRLVRLTAIVVMLGSAAILAAQPRAVRGETPASHRGRRGAPLTRRDDRAYRPYVREEQRCQRGCIAGRMQLEFHHGLQAPGPQRGSTPPVAPGRGGRGRGTIAVMTLTTSAFPDGGQIPVKYTQAGAEASPPFTWSRVPDGTASFALIAHDVDAAVGNGTDDLLHWMLWNIPATVSSLPEGVPSAAELPDGTRQISATGPYYRGPGAAAAGPPHHYVFELFALDIMLDVPAVGAPPIETRAAVLSAMAGHVRGKAAYVGLFRRGS